MRCPHCQTENRDDRVACYHCGRDLSMIRLITNKAKIHFNEAVEHAREGRLYEALGELNSALELNSRLVEAHVLRGSILGRLERVEEAREALDEALRLSPQAARAHRYLLELGQVERGIPLLRRLRVVLYSSAGAVGVALLILVGSLALLGGRAGAGPSATSAWKALDRGEFLQAAQLGEKLDADERQALNRAIDVAVEQALGRVRQEFQAGRITAALSELEALESRGLPERARVAVRDGRLALLRGRASQLAQSFGALLDAAERGDAVPLAVLEERARSEAEFRATFPGDEAVLEEALKPVRSRAVAFISSRLAEASILSTETNDESARIVALQRLAPLAAEVGLSGELETLLEQLANREAERLFGRALEAAQRGEVATYEGVLAQLRTLPGEPEAAARAAGLRSILLEREQASVRRRLATALADGSDREALDAFAALEALGAIIDGPTRLQLEETRRRLATTSYYALMQMADSIEARTLSESELAEALLLIEFARGPMPPRLADRAAENLHHLASLAYEQAGETERAAAERESLRERFPASAYLVTDAGGEPADQFVDDEVHGLVE